MEKLLDKNELSFIKRWVLKIKNINVLYDVRLVVGEACSDRDHEIIMEVAVHCLVSWLKLL